MLNKLKNLITILLLCSGLIFFLAHLTGIGLYHDDQPVTSLPWRWYLLVPLRSPFRQNIQPGDYILFLTDRRMLPYYRPGVRFGKRVVGMPGDVLTVRGRDFFLNGRFIARAREKDSLGNPAPLFTYSGKIPQGCYFVLGHHPKSFDSRYWGFVCKKSILGRLIPLGGRVY
jgi:signal peptidase I